MRKAALRPGGPGGGAADTRAVRPCPTWDCAHRSSTGVDTEHSVHVHKPPFLFLPNSRSDRAEAGCSIGTKPRSSVALAPRGTHHGVERLSSVGVDAAAGAARTHDTHIVAAPVGIPRVGLLAGWSDREHHHQLRRLQVLEQPPPSVRGPDRRELRAATRGTALELSGDRPATARQRCQIRSSPGLNSRCQLAVCITRRLPSPPQVPPPVPGESTRCSGPLAPLGDTAAPTGRGATAQLRTAASASS